MSTTVQEETRTTADGAAIYDSSIWNGWFYDLWVLGICNSFIWRAPTSSIMLPFFKSHIRPKNHLDIGVGTGYFLRHADLPPHSFITLSDLCGGALSNAEQRILRSYPEGSITTRTIEHDIEKPLPTSEKFDSISLFYLLHCMPGPPSRKVAVFKHLRKSMADDGVLFGTSVLGKSVQHNWLGTWLLGVLNSKKIMDNYEDNAEAFIDALKEAFDDVQVDIKGANIMFVARKPKP